MTSRRGVVRAGVVSSALIGVMSVFASGCECEPSNENVDASVARVDAFSEEDARVTEDAPATEDALVVTEDAPAAEDTGSGGVCTTYRLVSMPIEAITVRGASSPAVGRTLRFDVHVTAPNGCYSDARPLVTIDDATHTIGVVARAFVREGGAPCTEALVPMVRTLTIHQLSITSYEGSWTIEDAREAGTLSVAFTLEAQPGSCTPEGSCCVTDRSCTGGGERCLENGSTPTPLFACAVPCEDDLECYGGTCESTPGGIPQTCEPGGCATDADCPEHFVCDETFHYCSAQYGDYNVGAPPSCSCSEECGPGLACVPDSDGNLHCQIRCHLFGTSAECKGDSGCSEWTSTCV